MSYIEGTVVRFYTSTPFTDFAGTPVNPDLVHLKYEIQGQTEVVYTWVNPTGDPTSHIINTATGYFQADLDTTGMPGVWTWGWSCHPSSGTDVTATQTVWTGEVTISPSDL
jgi:hypothetical protein